MSAPGTEIPRADEILPLHAPTDTMTGQGERDTLAGQNLIPFAPPVAMNVITRTL